MGKYEDDMKENGHSEVHPLTNDIIIELERPPSKNMSFYVAYLSHSEDHLGVPDMPPGYELDEDELEAAWFARDDVINRNKSLPYRCVFLV